MNIGLREKNVDAENLPAVAEMPEALLEPEPHVQAFVIGSDASHANGVNEPLAALFEPEVAKDFRSNWDGVQSGFVDDPRQAVRQADELVAQVMKSLAGTFGAERAKLEGQVDPSDKASTEDLRVALRRYRSFFERLLSL